MRSQLWLLAASGHLACADWTFGQDLDYRGGEVAHLLPRETRASDHDGANGWTPRPTEGPSFELARRRHDWARLKRQSDNTWVDETTCGWRANSESVPFTCPASHTCATNTDHVVGCTSSDGDNPFFTVCLDYQAVQNGACESVGPRTGCCMTESIGQCITYLWPGATVKSMYRCYTERAVITMLSSPPGAESTSVSTTSTTSTSESSTSETASGTTDPAPGETETEPPTSESGGSNTGAIVGGVVGGVAGLALIAGAIAFVMIRSRKKKNNVVGGNTAYSAVAPGDAGFPSSPMPPVSGYPPSHLSPQMNQGSQYYNPSTIGSTTYPETPYLGSTTPQPPGAYDMRHSYYDPSKPADQQQPGAYAPYPGAPYPGPYHPPAPISELDNTNVAPGQQNNPVEMGDNGPTNR
ncbi:hypothetical protein F5144DRAFT_599805 [Chaetomium tenue]|uniref:Uncharacterized protein n=1 Tax=Chaetomium tenue TaxID=1854479 RepID=A0ACB7PJD4_9PEZI|nr:hypothetical protein F5144DRAFT_599805 [Chaetomium globosum]